MFKRNGFCFDIEGNGLYFQCDTIWTIVLKDLYSTKFLRINPLLVGEEATKNLLSEWMSLYEDPLIVGHYITGYDLFVLRKVLGIDFSCGPDTFMGQKCQYIDTWYLSMFLDPDRKKHSLESYGEEMGLEKIDLRKVLIDNGKLLKSSKKGDEFLFHSEEMDVYCERDVDVNILAFHRLFQIFSEFYLQDSDEIPTHYKCGQKSSYLMACQELTGWWFDQKYASEVLEQLEKDSKVIEDEVLPLLPLKKMNKGERDSYTLPAKIYVKDGFSSTWKNFAARHGITNVVKSEVDWESDTFEYEGEFYPLEPKFVIPKELPMKLSDDEALKDWFLSQGWMPSEYNFKKDSNGKPVVDAQGKWIRTSPKIRDGQKICPNLLKIQGELPQKIVKWMSLRNRAGVLKGWLSNARLEIDGRLPAGRTSITPTHRQKHSVVVNVPKASESVLYGIPFRKLFSSPDGRTLAAADAKGLENRVEGHYTFPYDKGARARELLQGDVHSKMAKVFFPKETKDFDIYASDFSKDHPIFSKYRSLAKNGGYALLYGCKPPKLASTLGKPKDEGQTLFDAYWENNPSLASLKKNLEKYWSTTGKKRYIKAIDGRFLVSRKKESLINLLFQSCGAIAMDYALCFFDAKMGGIQWEGSVVPYYSYKGYIVKRVGYHHDEATFEVDPEIAEEIATIFSECIAKAGKYLKLNVPLEGDWKVGKNWKEIH